MTRDLAHDEIASSGARLVQVIAATGLSIHQFAGYWAGFPIGQGIHRDEESERGRRFRTYRRSLFRWRRDDQTIGEDLAREIVAVANRLLLERGADPFPADFLVTPEETKLAGLEAINVKLDRILELLLERPL